MDPSMVIDPVQIKMARAALGWTRDDLAARAEISVRTMVRLETGENQPRRAVQRVVRLVLEQEGIRFPGPLAVDASAALARNAEATAA